MAKDHKPSGFNRTSEYKSDLEVAETASDTKRVNTSFGSQNHNAYIMKENHTHEHFYYDPAIQKSGWHGSNYQTRNNHPNLDKGENQMDKNSFLDSLKVDSATIERCNEVGRSYANNVGNQTQNEVDDDGGRERCSYDRTGSIGRDTGYQTDNSQNAEVDTNTVDNEANVDANAVDNNSVDNDNDNGVDME